MSIKAGSEQVERRTPRYHAPYVTVEVLIGQAIR